MSLSTDDMYTLENWFCELQLYQKGTDQYYKLRDKIYTLIYHKLSDLLRTKTNEWSRKYFLKEEDAQSIFNDALLACVEGYQPKRNKFITYFWTSCENLAKNYYKHYRRMRRIPPASLVDVDFTRFLGEDTFEPENVFVKDVLNHLRTLHDTDVERQEKQDEIRSALKVLQTTLSSDESEVLSHILVGYSMTQISYNLDITLAQVIAHMRKIRKKAQAII